MTHPSNQPARLFPFARTVSSLLTVLVLFLIPASGYSQQTTSPLQTRFEKTKGKETAEYQECIGFYEKLANKYSEIKIQRFGSTDSGWPLHLVSFSYDGEFDLENLRKQGRGILLINNAIHPGESDGIDASMMMIRDYVQNKEKHPFLKNTFIGIIPFYNVGGALNRNRFTRANQNGPFEYGFRGNARNFDLNRDFIKADTKNARTFAQIFHYLKPDLFLDTHVSNGSDHQHVMTTTHSQKDKLGGKLGHFFHNTMERELFERMKKGGFHTIPYVNNFRSTPDQGFPQFLETPRYSTGYTALFGTMGFMTESHMLRPYPMRVKATRMFLENCVELLAKHKTEIQELKRQDLKNYTKQKEVAVSWKVDPTRKSKLQFLGYKAIHLKSKVTAGQRLFYDRSQPFDKKIDYYNHYIADQKVNLPAAYIVPKGWHKVIELFRLNKIILQEVSETKEMEVEVYRIEDVSSVSSPYEGHYFHDKVKLSKSIKKIKIRKGDFVVSLDQPGARYIVETLEPQATDSFFRWNFFDTVLQQKEYYSPYIFEESAEAMLKDTQLRKEFEERKKKDEKFSTSRSAQLQFLFERSKHYEPAHRTYPIYRIPRPKKMFSMD